MKAFLPVLVCHIDQPFKNAYLTKEKAEKAIEQHLHDQPIDGVTKASYYIHEINVDIESIVLPVYERNHKAWEDNPDMCTGSREDGTIDVLEALNIKYQ